MSRLTQKTFTGETLIGPTMSVDGSSRADLVAQYANAEMSLMRAIEVLREATPHMRDYQPEENPADYYRTAMFQHQSRMMALEGMRDEFHTLAHIAMEASRA